MDALDISMRTNLWDDPRVANLCDKTGCAEAQVIGGLYWLWAAVRRHGQDGRLANLAPRAIDRKTGIPGFSEALRAIDWLRVEDGGVFVPRVEEHAQAAPAPVVGPSNNALPPAAPAAQATPAGLACRAMRRAGIADGNPSHPQLLALLQAGATVEELAAVAEEAAKRNKGFSYALAMATKRRQEAAEQAKGLHQGQMPGVSPTVPSKVPDQTQAYLASQERTPEQVAEAAARAREIRQSLRKRPTGVSE